MTRRRAGKFRPKVENKASKNNYAVPAGGTDAAELAGEERYFEFFYAAVLLALGIYQSVLYFGHTVVPIPDFPDFFRVGREILSLKIPSSFKLAPVLGMLQYSLSLLLGGQHPDLTAGWLLNTLLHPFNLLLFWLVGKKVVGRSALWFAIVVILNPWVVYMLTEPVIETTLLFFVLLTFYFIFRRSNWCYLFAAITTMVRYEGAALIAAAFVMDMIYGKSRRERTRSIVYSAMAFIPLAIWLLATVLFWKSGTSHYFNVLFTKDYAKGFTEPVENRTGIVMHLNILWQAGFRPLLMPYPGSDTASLDAFWKLGKILAFAGFSFGAVYGLCKRQWKILALLVFFVPYFLLHSFYPYPLPRFHVIIFWIAVLICWFGLQNGWKLIDKNGYMPKGLILALQILSAVIAIVWLISLVPYLPQVSSISPSSAWLLYAATTVILLIFAARIFVYKYRCLPREILILVFSCLIIVSNQFTLAPLLGDGQREKEFKLLADWYVANARPGEKLGVYMCGVVKIFAPKYAEYIVGLPKAENPSEFVKACYENDITYVVWATREGLTNDEHTGYRQLRLDTNIAMLREPKNIGPYEFVTQLGSKRGYLNVFRLRRHTDNARQKPPAK